MFNLAIPDANLSSSYYAGKAVFRISVNPGYYQEINQEEAMIWFMVIKNQLNRQSSEKQFYEFFTFKGNYK